MNGQVSEYNEIDNKKKTLVRDTDYNSRSRHKPTCRSLCLALVSTLSISYYQLFFLFFILFVKQKGKTLLSQIEPQHPGPLANAN